jgi:protoporphyrinogen oxidase
MNRMSRRTAIIIGAGPAGLTAAYELLKTTDIKPVVLEMSGDMGGISRTINYKGNRIDIGGHRFFSKSDRVMDWWMSMMPVEGRAQGGAQQVAYQGKTREVETSASGPDATKVDEVMLLRERTSRIYYLRRFFDYPVSLSPQTVMNLGPVRMAKIGLSYLKAAAFPIPQEKNLEQFFINRFGRELYLTFFKSYTEKVWGRACEEISAEWGAQRIKGLNVTKTLLNAAKSLLPKKKAQGGVEGVRQKGTETSLIEQFLYPKFGPGQMWEEVAKKVQAMGGDIVCHQKVVEVQVEGGKVKAVVVEDTRTKARATHTGDFFFSTMPIKELVASLKGAQVPENVKYVSENLPYRDFITVGLLLSELKLRDASEPGRKLVRDNWIYVQEPDVQVGRLQIFNNWSPYMVADASKVWIGLEYFCQEGDALWSRPEADMVALGKEELQRIDIIDASKVEDAVVIRQPKTYPAYFGVYERFDEVRSYLDGFENLFLVGRNGMHKYNNQDHSMLTAMTAVENIAAGRTDKSNIWAVNTEGEYHEEKGQAASAAQTPGATPSRAA